MWTVNFRMFKLVLEKAEEPEIKLPTSAGSEKEREFQENIYFFCTNYVKAFDCVDYNSQNVQSSEGDRDTRPPALPLEKPVWGPGSNS